MEKERAASASESELLATQDGPGGNLCGDFGRLFWPGVTAQSYQNVSRETFWYDWGRKPYKESYASRLQACGIARNYCKFGGRSIVAQLLIAGADVPDAEGVVPESEEDRA